GIAHFLSGRAEDSETGIPRSVLIRPMPATTRTSGITRPPWQAQVYAVGFSFASASAIAAEMAALRWFRERLPCCPARVVTVVDEVYQIACQVGRRRRSRQVCRPTRRTDLGRRFVARQP